MHSGSYSSEHSWTINAFGLLFIRVEPDLRRIQCILAATHWSRAVSGTYLVNLGCYLLEQNWTGDASSVFGLLLISKVFSRTPNLGRVAT